eukprot:SAG31_NODE_24881_length_472_cov_1.568365_1_plen_47_part_01
MRCHMDVKPQVVAEINLKACKKIDSAMDEIVINETDHNEYAIHVTRC